MPSNDQLGITEPEKLKLSLRIVIRNINRVIWNWNEKNTRRGKVNYTISYTEVRGLMYNWFMRILRSHMSMNVIQRMLRHGRPSILLDQNTGFVKEIRFVNISEYYYKDASNFRDAIQNILDSINYKELYYDPNDHTLDNIDPASLVSKIGEEEIHYNSAIHFSLPTLSNY